MRSLLRNIVAAFGGIAISMVLFAVIQAMTVERDYAPDLPTGIQDVEFVRVSEESSEPPQRRLPKRPPPPPPEDLPPPPPPLPPSSLNLSGLSVALPTFNVRPRFKGVGLEKLELGETREAVAVSTPRPMYPTRAQRMKINGKVKVEFTVTPEGRVADIAILGAEPRGIFERTVLKGVARWRFKPRLENGKPVAVRIRQTIIFQPGDDQ